MDRIRPLLVKMNGGTIDNGLHPKAMEFLVDVLFVKRSGTYSAFF